LEELAGEARRVLSLQVAEALLTEVKDHLDDGVQARLELGLDLETAERETIQAFGDAREWAGLAARSDIAFWERARRRWLLAFFAMVSLFMLVPTGTLWAWLLHPDWLLFLLVGCYGRACYFVRRPSTVSKLSAVGIALFVPTMMVVARIQNGGFGSACRNLLYQWPREAVDGPIRGLVDSAYELRFVWAILFAATIGVDFVCGTLGTVRFALRRGWRIRIRAGYF
jgi:hypothetical protein